VDDAHAKLGGVWAAAITPIDGRLRPAALKAIAYYRELLDAGCDGINLLGTTGEAMSFGVRERLQFMEAIARSGLPVDRIMAGTGAASLDDTVELTQRAFDCGFAAALVMPPFFYREAGDDGVLRFFDALLARVDGRGCQLVLYNFPLMSGITFRADLVDRLLEAFPQRIVGLKDSSSDLGLQAEILRRNPWLAVFPGSEEHLVEARAYGAAGVISGSVALWPALAQIVYRRGGLEDARDLSLRRRTLAGLPLIAAVRACIARRRDDDSWDLPMPPLVPLALAQRAELTRRLAALGL
jgi:4-hydroxy-tetrahydrodipicolinate synthase